MTNIDHLLPQSSQPIFDQEQMNREMLYLMLESWLKLSYFEVISLEKFKSLVVDIEGKPPLKKISSSDRPETLNNLHCIKYAELSGVNCRAALQMAFDYIGLDARSGPDVLGLDPWNKLTGMIERKVNRDVIAQPPLSKDHLHDPIAPLAVDSIAQAWSQKAIAMRLKGVMTDTSFSVYELDNIRDCLIDLRTELGLPCVTASISGRESGLNALSRLPYAQMDPELRDDVPTAILEMMGLDDATGTLMLGTDTWSEVKECYRAGVKIKLPECNEVLELAPSPPKKGLIHQWKSFFAKH